jgi:hypothetical protein
MSREDHWVRWHDAYDDPTSNLSRRLIVVQQHVRAALDAAPEGPVTILSLCAGQGRDVLEVLRAHPRRADASARLVELDPRNARVARETAAGVDALSVEIVEADAGLIDSSLGAAPADLLLLVGIFGNVPVADIERTVSAVPMLCRRGGTTIWTRSRRPPDLTPTIRAWFSRAGCEEIAFVAPADALFSVGVERFVGVPVPPVRGRRLFAFEDEAAAP